MSVISYGQRFEITNFFGNQERHVIDTIVVDYVLFIDQENQVVYIENEPVVRHAVYEQINYVWREAQVFYTLTSTYAKRIITIK